MKKPPQNAITVSGSVTSQEAIIQDLKTLSVRMAETSVALTEFADYLSEQLKKKPVQSAASVALKIRRRLA